MAKPKKRTKYKDVWTYTDMNYRRSITKGMNDAVIEFHDYKGRILMNVSPAKNHDLGKLAAAAGVTVGTWAWLDANAIDRLMVELRLAKKAWLTHYRFMLSAEKCKACKERGWALCAKHKALKKKLGFGSKD